MDFISNREPQIKEMLAAIGVDRIEDLFVDIPKELMKAPPSADDGLSEMEGMQLIESLAAMNAGARLDRYLGAGAYEHHVPAIVNSICQKAEFLTTYTPYQPECSQGSLQAIFEFQSAVAALTGLDVANASVYDGAVACAEGLLMALRQKRKASRILVAGTLNPLYRKVVDQYLGCQQVDIITIPGQEDGSVDRVALSLHLNEDVAAVLIQSPNFLGVMEDAREVFAEAKACGALSILCANPLSFGIYASGGELGADIVVGDVQPLGIPLQFGGPYAGFIACTKALVRQMPGRLVGETVDTKGRRGFVLTLQAREQHIRREKATSNICSNQALAALASLVTMLWYGKEGLKKLALTNFQRAMFLKAQLKEIPGVELLPGDRPIFNEFVVRFDEPIENVLAAFRDHDILGGVALQPYLANFDKHLLVTVTETKSKTQLERYIDVARSIVGRRTHHL